jgi:hypothetical protein
VDKPDFLHKLKGLRAFEAAEQGLRLVRTLTGQKIGCVQVAWFRTFDPVDIHGLVHRVAGFQASEAVLTIPDKRRGRDPGRFASVTGVGKIFARSRAVSRSRPVGRSFWLVRSKPSS